MPVNDATRSSSSDAALFPDIEPYATGRIPLDAVHVMQWEACGSPQGVPLVFLHGGPGGGCLPHHRRFYDPAFWNILLYDQRGGGRSTLALAYTQAHPERVLGLVLRGIFLATTAEIDWFMHGMRNVFPEAWRAFVEALPPAERGDLLGNYYRRLTDRDPAVHLPTARAWDRYEGACTTLLPVADPLSRFDSDTSALAIARIEAHYFVNRGFLAPNQLLDGVAAIRHLPCTIVQGRYDIVCPPVTADALARAWPEAEYVVVPDAGHSVREPGITRELVAAVRRMQARVTAK